MLGSYEYRSLYKILKLLTKHDVVINGIVISIVFRRWDKSTQGLLGAIKYIEHDSVVMPGVLPIISRFTGSSIQIQEK